MYNVVYIHTHDSGRFFSPYGYNMPTPNIMEFAKDSLVFRNAHCASPTCSPSRAALLTGMYPHNCGMMGLAHRGFGIKDYSWHLASFLGRNGFMTALSGVQHEAEKSEMLPYEKLLAEDEGEKSEAVKRGKCSDEFYAEKAVDFINSYEDNRPFFLSFGMESTHRAYPDSTGYIDPRYVKVPETVADNAENRKDIADYMRAAQIIDECAGRVIDALKSSGKFDNSIIIVTTDHGVAMPFMKCTLYDGGTGIALMMRVPESPSRGQVTDALVSQIDVFPTLCDLLGLEKPENLMGKSLVPVFKDTTAEVNREIFSEVTYHAAYEPQRCIRTKRYKLIKRYDYHNSFVPANMDDSPEKRQLIQMGILDRVQDREMLFDLGLDPQERINLVSNPSYRDIYSELSKKLEEHMTVSKDPLAEVVHRVKAPEGAVVDSLSSINPDTGDFE